MNTGFDMLGLLFSPLGRYIAIAAIALVVLGGIYAKIRSDAIAEIEAAATADALKRTQDALRAGDAVNLSSDRLRDNDGHARD
jgi:hypothetical protein